MKLINSSKYSPEQILHVSTTAEIVDALRAESGDITYRNKTVLVIKDGTYEPSDDIDVNSSHWDLITSESGMRGSVYLDFTVDGGGTFSVDSINGTNLHIKGIKIAETVLIGSVENGFLTFENCEDLGGNFDNYGGTYLYYHPRISFINCFDVDHPDGFTLLHGIMVSGIDGESSLSFKPDAKITFKGVLSDPSSSYIYLATSKSGTLKDAFSINPDGHIAMGDVSIGSYGGAYTINVYDDTRPGQMFYYGTDPVAFIGSSATSSNEGGLFLYDEDGIQVNLNGWYLLFKESNIIYRCGFYLSLSIKC